MMEKTQIGECHGHAVFRTGGYHLHSKSFHVNRIVGRAKHERGRIFSRKQAEQRN